MAANQTDVSRSNRIQTYRRDIEGGLRCLRQASPARSSSPQSKAVSVRWASKQPPPSKTAKRESQPARRLVERGELLQG